MPRLSPSWKWIAMAAACAAVPPPALAAALAATAGTLFEAAPFVLVASVLPVGRARALVGLAGCGCRGAALPGALALPAIASCWLAFGPAVTLGRTIAALGFVAARAFRRRPGRGAERAAGARVTAPLCDAPAPDAGAEPLLVLATLVPAALGAALLRDAIVPLGARLGALPSGGAGAVWRGAGEALLGAALGLTVPCATAGIAVAAGLHAALPLLAAGLLATCGLAPGAPPAPAPVASGRPGHGSAARAPASAEAEARCDPSRCGDTRAATALLGLLLAYVAVRAPPGFVTPRLGPVIALGALAAFARLRAADPAPRVRWLAPVTMAAALVLGSPMPRYAASATTLDDAFAGEALSFTGVAHRSGSHTVLERYTITCCRIDAQPVAVALDALLAVPTGAWVAATGTLVRASDGNLRLAARRWQVIPAPRDPFAYR